MEVEAGTWNQTVAKLDELGLCRFLLIPSCICYLGEGNVHDGDGHDGPASISIPGDSHREKAAKFVGEDPQAGCRHHRCRA